MPGGYTHEVACNAQGAGTNTGPVYPQFITASASTNVKGSYTQLIASCPVDTALIILYNVFGYAASMGLDIAIGTSGSEQVIVPNILILGNTSGASQSIVLPLSIPAGTRIAARMQSTTGSAATGFGLTVLDGSFELAEGVGGYDAIGFNSATTFGTAVTASATANTKGSYSQLTASTARDYVGVFWAFDYQQVTPVAHYWSFDLAIGAAGSEIILIPDITIVGGGILPLFNFVPIAIPAGTRIAVRSQADAASTPAVGMTLYGAYR